MPIIKSAIKQMKQAEAARDRNRGVKVVFRNKVKAIQKDLTDGGKNSSTLVSDAFSAIDKAAKNGVIHKNAAARKKSRIVKMVNSANSKPLELKSVKKKVEKPTATTKKTTSTKKPAKK